MPEDKKEMKKKFNMMLFALKASGVLSKAMRNPEETLRQLVREAKTEEGRERLRTMKQRLIERYECRDIFLDLNEKDRVRVVIDGTKKSDLIKSDVREILTFLSWIPGVNVKKLIRDVEMVIRGDVVVVSFPLKESVKEVIRE